MRVSMQPTGWMRSCFSSICKASLIHVASFCTLLPCLHNLSSGLLHPFRPRTLIAVVLRVMPITTIRSKCLFRIWASVKTQVPISLFITNDTTILIFNNRIICSGCLTLTNICINISMCSYCNTIHILGWRNNRFINVVVVVVAVAVV